MTVEGAAGKGNEDNKDTSILESQSQLMQCHVMFFIFYRVKVFGDRFIRVPVLCDVACCVVLQYRYYESKFALGLVIRYSCHPVVRP